MMKLYSQSSIQAAGGDAQSDTVSLSYTIGSTMYSNFIGNEGNVIEGIQQPYEIFIVNSTESSSGILLSCSAYPNPVKDLLTLQIENYDIKNLSFELYNIEGKLLISNKIENIKTVISTSNLLNSFYLLKVIDEEKTIKTFKIIKTK
jgi:hypothetical protein